MNTAFTLIGFVNIFIALFLLLEITTLGVIRQLAVGMYFTMAIVWLWEASIPVRAKRSESKITPKQRLERRMRGEKDV